MKKIYATTVGSQMHGLATPESDHDIRYITLEPLYNLISPFKNHDVKVTGEYGDVESWELRNFVKHLCSGNPTMYEVIKSPLYDCNYKYSDKIRSILPLAYDPHKILAAHIGYAESQLSRYIRPALKDFGICVTKLVCEPEDTSTLLNIPKYKREKKSGYPDAELDGFWEENNCRRLVKATVAAYRVIAQCRQLIIDGDFKPTIRDYSLPLHNKLMHIKSTKPQDVTWGMVKTSVQEIEDEIQKIKNIFDKMPDCLKDQKAQIEKIEEILFEIYVADIFPPSQS